MEEPQFEIEKSLKWLWEHMELITDAGFDVPTNTFEFRIELNVTTKK